MRLVAGAALAGVIVFGVWQTAGCSVSLPGGMGMGNGMHTASGDFNLSGTLRTFDVVAGEEARASGTGSFMVPAASVSGGSLDIDAGDITLTAAADPEQKAAGTFQQVPPELGELCTNTPLVITVWVAPLDELDNVFESDQIYTINVTLNEDCAATEVSVTPDQLMPETLALIQQGEFAIGIGVLSPITGEVVIDRLKFGFEL